MIDIPGFSSSLANRYSVSLALVTTSPPFFGQIALFDALGWGGIEDGHYLFAPPFVERFNVVNQVFGGIGLVLPLGAAPSTGCTFG